MKQVLFYILIWLNTGCSTVVRQSSVPADRLAGILIELSRAQHNFNDTSTHDKIIGSYKSFNPTEAIFRKLQDELRESNKIVYQFTWQNDMPMITGNFRAIILDQASGKRYYCSGSGHSKELHIRTTASDQALVDEKVLNSFLSKDFDYMRSIQGRYSSAEIGENYTIYEIEINKPRVTLSNFTSVAVLTGISRN